MGEHREPLVPRSIAAIAETPAPAIIVSSEALEELFRNRQTTKSFQLNSGNQNSSSFHATSRNGLTRAIRVRSRTFDGPIRSSRACSDSLNLQTQGSNVGPSWQRLMAPN